MVNWDRQIRRFQENVQRFPWHQRIPTLYWRGRLVGLDKGARREGADQVAEALVGPACDDVANLARLEAVSATLRDERAADLRLNMALRDMPYVFGPEGGACVPRWDEHVHKSIRDVIKYRRRAELKETTPVWADSCGVGRRAFALVPTLEKGARTNAVSAGTSRRGRRRRRRDRAASCAGSP